MSSTGGVKKSGGSGKKPSVTKSAKAGLVFPVARINRRLTENKTTKRVGAGAPVYMTAIVEYYAAEILELAIKEVRGSGDGRSRITPQDVLRAVRNDKEINKTTSGLVVMVGDKAKDTAELITAKSDADAKLVAKMREASEWFTIKPELDAPVNFKLFAKMGKMREASEWFEYDNEADINANYQRFVAEFKAAQDAGGAEE